MSSNIFVDADFFKKALGHLPIRVFWKDGNSRYLGCNQLFLKDAGLNSVEEIKGKSDTQLPWSTDAEQIHQNDLRILKLDIGEFDFQELQIQTDTEKTWFKVSKTPLFDDRGNTVGIIGCLQEISDYKKGGDELRGINEELELDTTSDRPTASKATAHLQTAIARLQAILDAAYDGVIVFNEKGVITSANQGAERIFAYAPNELIGERIDRLVPQFDTKSKGPAPIKHELLGYKKDLTQFPLECSLNEIPLNQQRMYLIVIRENYTHKRMENQLRAREHQLRTFLNGSTAMIWWMDSNGHPLTFNKSWHEFAGESVEQALHTKWSGQDIHPDDRVRCLDTYKRCLSEHMPFHQEYRRLNKSGEYRWLHESGMPQFSEGKHYQGYIGTSVDITVRKELEYKLRENEERHKDFFESSADLNQVTNRDGRFIYVNPAWKETLGYSDREIEQMTVFDILHPDSKQHCLQLFQRVLQGEEFDNIELKFVAKAGNVIFVEGNTSCRFIDGVPEATRGSFRDITSRKQAEERLYEEKQRLQVTLKSIGDAVITTDVRGVIEYLNPVAEKLTGWLLSKAIGLPISKVLHIINEDSRKPCQNPVTKCLKEGIVVGLGTHRLLIDRYGAEHLIQNSAAPIRNQAGNLLGAIMVFSDVTEKHRLAQQIAYHASHDALTELVNRREFEKRLDRTLTNAQKESKEHVLCYLDLDQFKVVNDTCGHVAGDELLRQIATLLRKQIRARDTLGRLGGDEFGILMEHCTLERAKHVADKLRQAVANFRFSWEDKIFNIAVSLGIVAITKTEQNSKDLLIKADTACYAAKRAGRNRTHVYQEDDIELAKQQGEMQWVSRINHALENNLFCLYCQPIKDLKKPKNLCYELLIRMLDKGDELISPGAFLPAAERYGLVTKIDCWVIQTAFRWLSSHPQHLERLHQCSINLSGYSLGSQEVLAFILKQFDESKIPKYKICLEVTETAAIRNLPSASQFIETLRNEGCQFALDDFGSGLASFAYLKTLPVDYLKIDGTFVKNILTDSTDLAMVKAINEIGHVMGKQTIAEFAENGEILNSLTKMGVDFAQGYGIQRPQAIDKLLF